VDGTPIVTWLTDAFDPAFMQRALLAGSLVALVAALVGTWVVLRGLTFMGDALAHGVLPGIALGVLIGFDLVLGAVVSALVMVTGINLIHRYSKLGEDAGIGLLFVGMLALGVVIISRSDSYAGSLTGILFGDALGVTTTDIWIALAAAAVAIVVTRIEYRSFLALSFNEQKATMLGLNPRLSNTLMLALVTMVVVTSFRAVGTLLVFGLLVAPPATAALIARRVPMMMALAAGLGVWAVVVGLLISYHGDTAASATIAAVAVTTFFLVMTGKAVLVR
jgi:manganese/iron transport system permease protein